MAEDELVLLREIAANTAAISHLLAVSVPRGFTTRLRRLLDSEQKRKAYQFSDGERSAREVARLVDATHPTVGRWWEDWEAKGIAEATRSGRTRAIFNLNLMLLADQLEEGNQ